MDLDREQYINSVNLNIDTDFPYLVLDVINDNSFPRNPGFHVMHWHEDLQFIFVLDGTIEVQTLDTSVLIRTGDVYKRQMKRSNYFLQAIIKSVSRAPSLQQEMNS